MVGRLFKIMKVFFLLIMIALVAGSCVPKEQIVLREIHILEIQPGKDGNPLLRADAIFYNPNNATFRLKEIEMTVLLDGKEAARIDQNLSSSIMARSEFTVPLEVQLHIKEMGLLDTILSLFGGKKYEVEFSGSIKVKVRGFPLRIPVNHKDQIKL